MLIEKFDIRYVKSPLLGSSELISHAFMCRPTEDIGKLDQVRSFKRSWDMKAEEVALVDQVHGSEIVRIKSASKAVKKFSSVKADAIITDVRGLPIGICTADCVPILLFDDMTMTIGAVHAGWRGTSLGIVEKTIDKMIRDFGTDPKNLKASIGPHIGPCCYTVGDEVYNTFKSRSKLLGFTKNDEGKFVLNLAAANRHQLIRRGVPQNRIDIIEYCTSCRTDLFYSYRKEGEGTGRNLNFILLKKLTD